MSTTCDICKSKVVTFHHRYFQFPVIACLDCGFIRARDNPTEDDLKNFYSRYFYETDFKIDVLTLKRYQNILDQIEPVRKTNRILDFGCGTGLFLEVARERGWDVVGVEISELAIQHLKKKNIPCLTADNSQPFDAVICIEVIEHVANPRQTIEWFAKMIRPGGYLYLTTPNITTFSLAWMKRDYLITYPEHLSYFTVGSMKRMLSDYFNVVDIRTTGISPVRKNGTRDSHGAYVYDIAMYRNKSESNPLMRTIKKLLNLFLTTTEKGDTIKVFAKRN
jgi:SAM-dependent methyltransferase